MMSQENWYLSLQGLSTGPYSTDLVTEWLKTKQIQFCDAIFDANKKKWALIRDTSEFSTLATSQSITLESILGEERIRYCPAPAKKGISWREKKKKFFTPIKKEEIKKIIVDLPQRPNLEAGQDLPKHLHAENLWTFLDDLNNFEETKKKKQEKIEEPISYLEREPEQGLTKIIFYLFLVLGIGFAAFSFYFIQNRSSSPSIEQLDTRVLQPEAKKEGNLPESIPANPPTPTLLPPVRPQRD